jgi:hypothetical protein
VKFLALALAFSFFLLFAAVTARADLTIVQKVEGVAAPGEMTIKVKGDKVRMEASPQVTMIFDGKTGEMTTLMNDEKKAVRLSAEKMKAAAEMVKKFTPQSDSAEKPKFVATGRKESVNGSETEQYVCESPDFKATYWIALNYPNGAAILKQLQSIKSDAWNAASTKMPDYHDLPGIPLRTRMVLKSGGDSGQNEISTTIVSIKTDPLGETEFSVPKDFKEMEMPDIFGGQRKPADRAQSPGP